MYSITTTRYAMIMAIHNAGEALSIKDFREKLPDIDPKLIQNTTSSMKNNGFLVNAKNKKGGYIAFELTKKGRDIGKADPSTVDLVEPMRQGARKKSAAKPEAQEAQFDLNYSPQANAFVDQISGLLEQNAGYRNLLMQVYTTIGKALQLDKEIPDGES